MAIPDILVKFLADDAQFQSVSSKMKSTLVGLGGTLAGLFAADKIKDFGVDSIKAAAEAQPSWTRLAQQIRNVGGDYAAVRPEVERMAAAIQDTTTIDDEGAVDILRGLVAVTGDYKASLGEVATVTDLMVGAHMDQEAAARLVGRAMVGDTSTLKRYGIVVKEGQNAMDALRERFKGLAQEDAKTLDGQVKQLSGQWGNFQEAIGDVLISAGEGGSVLSLLTDTVKDMAVWVGENKETLVTWVKGGINIVVGSMQVFGRTTSVVGNMIVGFGSAVVSSIVRPFQWALDAIAWLGAGVEKFWRVLGQDEKANAIAAQTAQLRSYADTLKRIGDTTWGMAKLSIADAGAGMRKLFSGPYGVDLKPSVAGGSGAAALDLPHIDLDPDGKQSKKAAAKLAKEIEAALKKADYKVHVSLDPASLEAQGFAGTKLARGEALAAQAKASMQGPVSVAAGAAPGPTLGMYLDAAKGLGLQSVSQGLDLLKGSAMSLVGGFTPLGPITTAVSAAMEPMQPALDALLLPVRAVGQLLGGVFAHALSYVAEGLGWLIYGLAKAVDKLIPFGDPLKGVEKFGKEMIDGAKAARRGLDDVHESAEKVASSLVNVSRSVNVTALRRAVTGSVSAASKMAPTGGGDAGGNTFTGDIHLHGVQDPDEFLDQLGRVAQRKGARGGSTRLGAALALT